MYVIVIGPAGAGKTSIAKKISDEIANNSILVNLDPATKIDADIDIRKWVKIEELQEKYGLGINGALLKSMEIIAGMNEWIVKDKNKIKVIDTPGQLEIFLYHDYGKKIIEKLQEYDAVTVIFVVDAYEAISPENYIAMLAQNAIINLRLSISSITAINKIDLVDKNNISKFFDRKYLEKEIENADTLLSLAKGLLDYIEYTTIYTRPLLISAKTGEGLNELYDVIHEIHCTCGDLS
ncbi:MAG: hypothetical protein FE047_02235 [Thermoplasmata archaeon]|nr:MAG: hypothetical protein FE047_02235 [Thermoplasmata archaeon]